MVGSLPHVSDLNLLSGTNRGSAFDVSCANELEVKIVRDFRGTVTTQNLSSSDYDIVFANSFAGLCTDINTLAVSSGGSCSSATACTGQPLFFRIKLKTGVPVSSYSRLVVSLKSNALGSIIGTEGNASFVFGYNEAAGQVQETGVATIIIAEISDCKTEPPCAECENSFAPSIDSAYVLSAWVKEGDTYGVATYDNVNITLFFEGLTPEVDVTLGPFYPSGDIIDGWQRVEQVFTVPSTALKIKIILNNERTAGNVFFDDIRIHPFDATMVSYVFDPITRRLSAQLDERNYATFYEYDEEGALIRVKKETSRGVMTTKENRKSTKKQ